MCESHQRWHNLALARPEPIPPLGRSTVLSCSQCNTTCTVISQTNSPSARSQSGIVPCFSIPLVRASVLLPEAAFPSIGEVKWTVFPIAAPTLLRHKSLHETTIPHFAPPSLFGAAASTKTQCTSMHASPSPAATPCCLLMVAFLAPVSGFDRIRQTRLPCMN